jgi:hypothetical protein
MYSLQQVRCRKLTVMNQLLQDGYPKDFRGFQFTPTLRTAASRHLKDEYVTFGPAPTGEPAWDRIPAHLHETIKLMRDPPLGAFDTLGNLRRDWLYKAFPHPYTKTGNLKGKKDLESALSLNFVEFC